MSANLVISARFLKISINVEFGVEFSVGMEITEYNVFCKIGIVESRTLFYGFMQRYNKNEFRWSG